MIHRKKLIVLLLLSFTLLSACDYSKSENRNGFFYNTFAAPMDHLLHWLGSIFDNNYGLAIISIVLIVRIIMLPFKGDKNHDFKNTMRHTQHNFQ